MSGSGDYPSVEVTEPSLPMSLAEFSAFYGAAVNGSSRALSVLSELSQAQFDQFYIDHKKSLVPPVPEKVVRGGTRILASLVDSERVAKIIKDDA